MATTGFRIGIVGCGSAARAHVDRLRAIRGVTLVGCADPALMAAESLAAHASTPDHPVPAFADHSELFRRGSPDAVAIFTPHPAHYRPAMDALQAGCHVFIEQPLSTSVQEAVDIAGLARARGLRVGVGHHYRLLPSLMAARAMLAEGAIGAVRLVTAAMAEPWLEAHRAEENSWRFDPSFAGGGILADSGLHLLDALLWTTRRSAIEVSAIRDRPGPGPELVAAAAIRLSDGTPATIGISGVSPISLFECHYYGESGRLLVTETSLVEERAGQAPRSLALPGQLADVDEDFVAAATEGSPPCCPADQAIDTVRLLEAICRSATIGQVVRLA